MTFPLIMMTNSVKFMIVVIKQKLVQSQQNFAYTKTAHNFVCAKYHFDWTEKIQYKYKYLVWIHNFIGEAMIGMYSTMYLNMVIFVNMLALNANA